VYEEPLLEQDTVFRVGRVVSVEGRRVSIAVDKLKNGSHLLYRGGIVRNVAVASYVKIVKGFEELIAKVDGEVVREDRSASAAYRRGVDTLARQLDVSLIGYLEKGRFERGVREMPLLDNECFILTEPEFELIHTFVDKGDTALVIGSLAMEPTQQVAVGVDAIFASHVGIFGNTGSGKSYTLAKLYHELFRRFGSEPGFRDKSQFVLIDFNGEYVNRTPTPGDDRSSCVIADSSLKAEYRLSTRTDTGDKLPLPRSAVHDARFWKILLDATEKTQAPFINRVLRSSFWDDLLPDADGLMSAIGSLFVSATHNTDPSVDRRLPINFLDQVALCLGDAVTQEFLNLIQDFNSGLDFRGGSSNSFYWRPTSTYANSPEWDGFIRGRFSSVNQSFESITDVDLIRFKLVMQFYRDIVGGFANREHIGPLIKRLDERVDGIKRLITVSDDKLAERPLTVVSFRDVNLDMRKVIPMILCKHLYEAKKQSDPSRERHLNLIIDEAHNILSTASAREQESWRDYRLETFEEIIKEGRKFGVFLTIASQRPHDISETIISQLHNYFLHRLVNNLDIRAIEKAVAYLDRVSFESLPILPTGACVLSGVSAQVPVVVKIAELPVEAAPNSRTMSLTTEWMKPLPTVPSADEHDADTANIDGIGWDEEPPF
jgi:DNA helicase HerA-like ATPase